MKNIGNAVTAATLKYCRSRGIRTNLFDRFDESAFLELASGIRPDVTFSIQNPIILSQRALDVLGTTVNYHNSVLPTYAGLNAPSWALVNGEKLHGVTWHIASGMVDGGDIIHQSIFQILPDWSVKDVITHCNTEAVRTFPFVCEKVFGFEPLLLRPQSHVNRIYNSGVSKPYGGVFPFWEDEHAIRNLQRAIDFYPAENRFAQLDVLLSRGSFSVDSFTYDISPICHPNGLIIGAGVGYFDVVGGGNVVRVRRICLEGRFIEGDALSLVARGWVGLQVLRRRGDGCEVHCS